MQPEPYTTEIKYLLEKNTELLKENNLLLKKLYKYNVIGFWLKVLWYMALVVIPFILYLYVLQPYIVAFGSSYDVINQSMQEIPGWRQFTQTLQAVKQMKQKEQQ